MVLLGGGRRVSWGVEPTLTADATFDPATLDGEADVLCESCGYRLNGLPDDGNCPECGEPVSLSTTASPRVASAWEASPSASSFAGTSARVVFGPTEFFRTLRTRVDAEADRRSKQFSRLHLAIAALLAGLAVQQHGAAVSASWGQGVLADFGRLPGVVIWLIVGLISFFAFIGVKALAARLTAWEANYRGLRLPKTVVRRGMDYHAASLPVVIALVLAVVLVFRACLVAGWIEEPATYLQAIYAYLGTLAGVCVAGAVYLFWTYWIGMKNMLYANV